MALGSCARVPLFFFLFVVLRFFVVKKTAFESRANELEIQRVIATLQWIQKHGDIRIYPVCQSCMDKTVGLGDVRQIVGGEGYAIF